MKLNPAKSRIEATEDLAQRAAKIIIEKYALPQNCTGSCNVGLLVPKSKANGKPWITKTIKLTSSMIAKGIMERNIAYGIGQTRYSQMIVLDVDNPERDSGLVEDLLHSFKWKYKLFDSGKGLHYWIFFTELPVEIRRRYKPVPKFLESLGKYLLDNHLSFSKDKIDIRGCTRAVIKLPLQFDHYYQKYVLPFDESGRLITDYEAAIDFAEDIKYNDSDSLLQFLPLLKQDLLIHRSKPIIHEASLDFQQWLDACVIGPGESNDKIFELVRKAYHAGIPEDDIPALVERLYIDGRASGRITSNDTLNQWLSKAKGRAKRYYHEPHIRSAEFFHSDVVWLYEHARRYRSGSAFLFLAIHLWACRISGKSTYFLSKQTASEFGISGSAYQRARNFYERVNVITVISHGDTRPYGGRATEFKFHVPAPSGDLIFSGTPDEFLRFLLTDVRFCFLLMPYVRSQLQE